MRKTVFAIFAHPDDEAFGPGGTIALLAQNADIYLLCATKGEAGTNHSRSKKQLAEKRAQELRKAAKILGVKKVYFLGFSDGELSNNKYHHVAEKIDQLVQKHKPYLFITYEPRGVSGHIDHIAISFISSYIFFHHSSIQELWHFCLSEKQRGAGQHYYIYFPPGYKDAQITKRVNIDSVLDQKIRAIKAHTSQIADVRKMIKRHREERIEECFLIEKKKPPQSR